MSSVGQQAIPSFVHITAFASLTTGWWMWCLLMASCMLADTRSFSNLAEWTPTWNKYNYCMKKSSVRLHKSFFGSYYVIWPHQISSAYHKDVPSCWRVSWLESLQVRQNVEAVDAAVSEKVQHTHTTFEILFQAQWMANIEPLQPWLISTNMKKSIITGTVVTITSITKLHTTAGKRIWNNALFWLQVYRRGKRRLHTH